MAQLPKISRLQQEDYPSETKKWISKLLQPLNSFMQSVTSALDRRLTINQNIQGQIRTLNVVGGKAVSFKYEPSSRPRWLVIGNVSPKDGYPLTAVVGAPQWSDDGAGNITVTDIIGLVSNDEYSITFLILS